MTAREMYEYALIELNKIEAPSLILEDYNYFINKAVQQYINLSYAKFEVDQQSTDDLRVLRASAILTPEKVKTTDEPEIRSLIENGIWDSMYFVNLPYDYMHLLNCVVEYTVNNSNFKCRNKGEKVYFAARRLTSDMYTQILNNAYMYPTYKRPYYFLNNINTSAGAYTPSTGLNPGTHSSIDSEILDYNNGNTDKGTAGTPGDN